jgi:DNA repair protein RecN (Recombination protein N)
MPRYFLDVVSVANLGVIDRASVEFDRGLTVLTGETGAGKTLLIDALTLCLGGDARTPRGSGELAVSALFVGDDGSEISLGRQQAPGGRLRGSIDGLQVSADALALRGADLLTIHGQHEAIRLRQKGELVRILDRYGGIDLEPLELARTALRQLEVEAAGYGGSSAQRERELDFLRHQFREIEAAGLDDPLELESALQRLTDLTALRDRVGDMLTVADQLDGESDEALLPMMAQAIHRLPEIDALDSVASRLNDALSLARDAVGELRELADPEAFDGSLFHTLEQRVAVLRTVARKFGGSLQSAIDEGVRLAGEIERLDGAGARMATLEGEIQTAKSSVQRESARVASLRQTAAQRLEVEVGRQLGRVALPHATLTVSVAGDDGGDVEIQFKPNPGAPAGSLHAIASGGELSRVLLALSLVTTRSDVVAVFDEVDAGIGGGVAQSIGDCLAELALTQQVVVVTHLATVAARADRHFVVEKRVEGTSTATIVREVTGVERTAEIARMLSGDSQSDESLALAERLLALPRPSL